MNIKKSLIFFLSIAVFLTLLPKVDAAVAIDEKNEVENTQSVDFIKRGEAISKVVTAFDLRKKQEKFLSSCLFHLDECFFVFSTLSHFDAISFSPLKLYPDVSAAYTYYDDINVATMLGLVHGYLEEKNSPFYPRASITRIQALKVIMGAGDFLAWKERFELVSELDGEEAIQKQKITFSDVDLSQEATWWYPRYLNTALSKGVIDAGEYFRPDELITTAEFDDMLGRALKAMK